MSYEGRVQVLCESGHYFVFDCHRWEEMTTEWGENGPRSKECEWRCDICGGKVVWSNSVDDTNCEEWGIYHLKVKEPEATCVCETCKRVHVAREATYHIPPSREQCPCADCQLKRNRSMNDDVQAENPVL